MCKRRIEEQTDKIRKKREIDKWRKGCSEDGDDTAKEGRRTKRLKMDCAKIEKQ